MKNIGLDKKVEIFSRDVPFSSDIGIVNIRPSKGRPWVCSLNETYFDSYGCVCPKTLSKFIIKRNEHCLYSEYKIQGLTNNRDSYCASYCLFILFLNKSLRNLFQICCFESIIKKILEYK